jgi:Ca2+-transporting ATPase
MKKNWHSISFKKVISILKTNYDKGLSSSEILKRQKEFGKNKLTEETPVSKFKIFIHQFKSPLVFILTIASLVTFFVGEYTDSIVILMAVILNTFLGYFEENKAKNALDSLKKILKVKAKVIRNNQKEEVLQEELVPGDIIILNSGDKVPADARIIESWNLKSDESILTGEWMPSEKNNKELPEKTNLADRRNMVYMGSVISSGNGLAVVVDTGDKTEVGKISSLIESIEDEETPYQLKIKKFSWVLTIIISIVTVLIFLHGILTGGDFVEMFTLGVAIAVAAIPEGLPIAITAILAVGMQNILKKKGLVRHLTSAETLGGSSIIATDKTLTLTEGKMEVQDYFILNKTQKELFFKTSSLANDGFIKNENLETQKFIFYGSPTDKALLKFGVKNNFGPIEIKNEKIIYKIPFNSKSKYSVTVCENDGKTGYIAGAPETLLSFAKNLDENLKKEVLFKINKYTDNGFRVIGLGYKKFRYDIKKEDIKKNLDDINFLGLIAIHDPIREGVGDAIKLAKKAGIKIIMVTGDHLKTGQYVAKKLGIKNKNGIAIEGKDLENMSDEELDKKINDIQVYARVEPRHKMRIIEAWQRKGEIIAMTGDGINDAPALQKSNLGISLGSGTDVAKEASDLILLGDNFSIIPKAIKEGRILIDNIRKVVTYLLSSAFSELILIGTSIILGLPMPVTALQILWVNLVEDALPSISFTFEKEEDDVMKRKPEPKDSSLLNIEMKRIITIISLVSNLILFGIFFYLLSFSNYTIEHIRTMIFVGLAIDSIFFVFSCKNLSKNIWQYNPFSNNFLNISVIISFLTMVFAIYLPFFQKLLETTPLNLIDWLTLVGFGFINLIIIEIIKWFFIKKN